MVVIYGLQAALAELWVLRVLCAGAAVIALLLLLTVGVWGPRTEVLPEGLRVGQGWRKNDVTWDEVQAVESPGRWDLRREVRVRLEDGSSVPLPGMPAERWTDDVKSYWCSHRSQSTDEPDVSEDGGR